MLVVFSTRDIEPHEEICFNYQGNYPEDGNEEEEEEEEKLKRDDPVYTDCKCGARNCTGMYFHWKEAQKELIKHYQQLQVQCSVDSYTLLFIHTFSNYDPTLVRVW